MVDAAPAVGRLLERAVRAGAVIGAVAGWGRDAVPRRCAVAGRAQVGPESRSLTDDTWFDLASLTKPLATSTLALLAVRSGALALRTSVGEVLTETRGSRLESLSLGSLLSHSSGLPAWLPLYWLAGRDPDRLPAVLPRIELVCAPGTRVIYSCIGFIVAGLMLQRVADAPLDRLFRDQVLRPLGLEDELGFTPDPNRRPLAGGANAPASEVRLVRDLGGDPASIPATGRGLPDDGNARFLGGAAGNAGLFGSLRGVWELASEYVAGSGRLLSPDEAACATASLTRGHEQERGLGWQLAATRGCSAGPALPPRAFGHTGFTGVSLWVVPDGTRFVLLGNRVHPGHRDVDLHPLRRRFHALAVTEIEAGSVSACRHQRR